jgi:hypothetical protein
MAGHVHNYLARLHIYFSVNTILYEYSNIFYLTYTFLLTTISFRLKEMGTDLSTMVHVNESGQPLRSYKNDLSAHPYFISLQDTEFGLHFSGKNSPRLYTCLPNTAGAHL